MVQLNCLPAVDNKVVVADSTAGPVAAAVAVQGSDLSLTSWSHLHSPSSLRLLLLPMWVEGLKEEALKRVTQGQSQGWDLIIITMIKQRHYITTLPDKHNLIAAKGP